MKRVVEKEESRKSSSITEIKTCSTLFLISLLVSSQTSFSVVGLPFHAKSEGYSNSELSLLLGVFPIATSISAFFAGTVSDFYGRKRMLISGIILFGISLAIHPLADDLSSLVFTRTITGIACGLLMGLPSLILSDAFSKHRQKMLIGKSMSGYAIGSALGIPAGIIWIGKIGYLELNAYIGLLALCLGVLAATTLPPGFRTRNQAARQSASSYFFSASQTIRRKGFLLILVVSFLSFLATSLFYVVFTLWLYEEAKLQTNQIAPIYALAGFSQAFVLVFLIHRIRTFSTATTVRLSFAFNAALFALAYLSFYSIAFATVLFALVYSVIALRIPSMQHITHHLGSSEFKGLRTSLVQSSNNLGKGLGASLATLLYAAYPIIVITMLSAGIMIICTISIWFLKDLLGVDSENIEKPKVKGADQAHFGYSRVKICR